MNTFSVFLSTFYILLLFVNFYSYGQTLASEAPPDVRVEKNITGISLNYLGATIYQERRVGSSITFLYGIGLHYSFYSTNFPIGGTRFINIIEPNFGRDYRTGGITPYAIGEVRVYHTLFRRSGRKRNVRYNSANYIALFGETPLAKGNLINVPNLAIASPVGLKYGFRRNLGQHFYVDSSLGIANKISRNQNTFLPRLDLGITWHL